MSNWFSDNLLLLIAFSVLMVCMIAISILPSRKKMMRGEISSVPSSKTKMAYISAIIAFVFVAILAILLVMKQDYFQEVMGQMFVFSNMILCGAAGMVLVKEAHWVSNFSHDLAQPATASVQVVEASTFNITCPMCKQEIILPSEMKGHIIQCPSCGVEGRVGGGSAASPAREDNLHSGGVSNE